MAAIEEKLRQLPSVDEVLKSPEAAPWLEGYPRRYVLQAVREVIKNTREAVIGGGSPGLAPADLAPAVLARLSELTAKSLRPVINATGIVIHTNLGRSALPDEALRDVLDVSRGYSTLEYDLGAGRRGKRYAHIKRLLRDVTGAEDGIAVNNNAAAVLLTLGALAAGREVIVSRGELVEIGGSFRVPDVMAQSGAILREVGSTNKTHLKDYAGAINERTGLILKVHKSNYRITGFTGEVSVGELAALGAERGVPVAFDLGSGSLLNLKPYGIHDEPTVAEVMADGPDIVTFSGDKLLGGPQAGLIVGRAGAVAKLQGHPLMRALRIDKMTLAALQSVLQLYIDEERALKEIPTLRMLTEDAARVKARAEKIAGLINKPATVSIQVIEDTAFAGGGSLPELELKTFAVAVRTKGAGPNRLEARLRAGKAPVIARIKDDALLLDARTVSDSEVDALTGALNAALK